jgi:hypothetical protein
MEKSKYFWRPDLLLQILSQKKAGLIRREEKRSMYPDAENVPRGRGKRQLQSMGSIARGVASISKMSTAPWSWVH